MFFTSASPQFGSSLPGVCANGTSVPSCFPSPLHSQMQAHTFAVDQSLIMPRDKLKYPWTLAMAIAGLAMLCVSYPARADTHDRPSLYATPLINGHPARLVMDTGASQPVLFSNRLEALGLHLQPLAA